MATLGQISRAFRLTGDLWLSPRIIGWSVAPSVSSNCGLTNLRSCAKASQNYETGSHSLPLARLMPATMLRRADRSILPNQRPVAPHHVQRRARGGLCISTLKEEHRIYPRRRSPQGPQGLCTSSNLMCRLAHTMGEVSIPVCSRSSSSSWVPNCAFRHAIPMWIT